MGSIGMGMDMGAGVSDFSIGTAEMWTEYPEDSDLSGRKGFNDGYYHHYPH